MALLAHRILTQQVGKDCTSFKDLSSDLCDTMGRLARKLATDVEIVDPAAFALLVACRLIALDKCPGVRPLGVGEVLSKAISLTLKLDIKEAAGPLLLHSLSCPNVGVPLHTAQRDKGYNSEVVYE